VSDENLFDFMVARSQARQTNTLAIASIASSASLVLFILNFQGPKPLEDSIFVLGVLFPLLGFAYYEIKQKTIQNSDFSWILKKIDEQTPNNEKEKVKKIILGPPYQGEATGICWRILLILPVLGWFYVRNDLTTTEGLVNFGIVIASCGFAILILILIDKWQKYHKS